MRNVEAFSLDDSLCSTICTNTPKQVEMLFYAKFLVSRSGIVRYLYALPLSYLT